MQLTETANGDRIERSNELAYKGEVERCVEVTVAMVGRDKVRE